MRGIVYKDLCLLFRTLDKRGLLACGALAVLFTAAGGVYAGLVLSAGMSMCAGALNVLAFEKEGDWGNYQRVLPLRGGTVVAGKYAAALLTALPCAVGAVGANLVFFAVYGRFAPLELGLSAFLAAVIPAAWAACTLPVYYWFRLPAARFANMLPVLALSAFFNQIGDGGVGWAPALVSMAGGMRWTAGCLILAGALLASFVVSAAGYCRRR